MDGQEVPGHEIGRFDGSDKIEIWVIWILRTFLLRNKNFTAS